LQTSEQKHHGTAGASLAFLAEDGACLFLLLLRLTELEVAVDCRLNEIFFATSLSGDLSFLPRSRSVMVSGPTTRLLLTEVLTNGVDLGSGTGSVESWSASFCLNGCGEANSLKRP
jgi:hypothetical protein